MLHEPCHYILKICCIKAQLIVKANIMFFNLSQVVRQKDFQMMKI